MSDIEMDYKETQFKKISLKEINENHQMIWKDNPCNYLYVREYKHQFNHFNCKPRETWGDKVIGFEKVIPYKSTLVYYLKEHDVGMLRDEGVYSSTFFPSEAVWFVD